MFVQQKVRGPLLGLRRRRIEVNVEPLQELRQAVNSISGRPGPMLSAYLNVNAAVPENQERAYLVRLREGMDHQEVPEELQLKVREYVEEQTHPGGRTLAIFADGESLFEVYRVQIDLPESVRYGEPNTSPLFLALDEQEPYGAALVDAERFRYFVVSPLEGSGEDGGGNGYREVDVSPGSPGPRSGMDQEPDSRRTEANVSQFYNEVGGIIRDVTFREGVKRLILAGPKERTSELRGRLPQDVADRVVAEENVDLGVPEGEILEQLESVREGAEEGRIGELLDEIREGRRVGLREHRNRPARGEPRLPPRHALGAGRGDPVVPKRRPRHHRHNGRRMPLLRPANQRPPADRRGRGPRREPGSPRGVPPGRERTHRHPARRVRRARGPSPASRARSSRSAGAGRSTQIESILCGCSLT